MDWEKYNTIIFDLGGVLLNIDYHLTAQAFENLGVKGFDDLYSQAKQSHLFNDLETGNISPGEFREQIRIITKTDLSDQLIDNAWNAMLLDFPIERMKLLEELGGRHNLLLMSNTNEIHVEAFTKIIEASFGMSRFRNAFSEVYFSSSIGQRKPNETTFQWILDENKLKAKDCLFIDDSYQHIEGARNIGITSHWLKDDIISFFSP